MISNYIGIDLNTHGHTVVVANPATGKVWKFGKNVLHIHKKYRELLRIMRREGKQKLIKNVMRRWENILKDLAYKISRKIIDIAIETNTGIKIETIQMRRTIYLKELPLADGCSLNTKYFHWLLNMIDSKAGQRGIPVIYVDADRTSQLCSRCGEQGKRPRKDRKIFRCPTCGHFDHADANAAFNIAMR